MEGRDSALFVHHRDLSSPIGTTSFYYLATELAESHEVRVVCRRRANERNGDSTQRAVLHDIDTGDVPVLSGLLFHLLSVLYVLRLSVTTQYDVTYCSQSSIVQGWVGARVSGSKFVIGLGSVPVRQAQDFESAASATPSALQRITMGMLSLYARVVRVLLKRASTVVCLTEGIADVTERTYGVDLSDAYIIGMGVDVETFAGPRRIRASKDRTDQWVITYIGAVRETRNLVQVVEVIAGLEYDLTFQIAGQGPAEHVDALIEAAEELGVSDRVQWLGLLPHAEIPQLLAETDFAVSPLPDIESYRISFPAKLLEYMAAGCVVIATEIPAHRKLIDDGVNGYLYDGSRDELADTIATCIENDGHLRDVRRRAVETSERYDWDVVAREFAAVVFGSERSDEASSIPEPE